MQLQHNQNQAVLIETAATEPLAADTARLEQLTEARAEDRAWRVARRAELERAVQRLDRRSGFTAAAIAAVSPMITNHMMFLARETQGLGRAAYGPPLLAATVAALVLAVVTALGTVLFVERRKALARQIAELAGEPSEGSTLE